MNKRTLILNLKIIWCKISGKLLDLFFLFITLIYLIGIYIFTPFGEKRDQYLKEWFGL